MDATTGQCCSQTWPTVSRCDVCVFWPWVRLNQYSGWIADEVQIWNACSQPPLKSCFWSHTHVLYVCMWTVHPFLSAAVQKHDTRLNSGSGLLLFVLLRRQHGKSATSVKKGRKSRRWFHEILHSAVGPHGYAERIDRRNRSTCTNERLIPGIEGCVPFYSDSWCTDPCLYSSSDPARVWGNAYVYFFCVLCARCIARLYYFYGEYEMRKWKEKHLCFFFYVPF